MGKFTKWIAGGLGWALFGFVGGLIGFALGSLLEGTEEYQKRGEGLTTVGDFAMSFLVLVAAVMKADGTVVKSELDYVKNYFIRTFGLASAKEAMLILRDLLKQNISLKDVTGQIGNRLDYASKLQMIHLLFELANADRLLPDSEIKIIRQIAYYLGINQKDFESLRAMYIKNEDAAYKILEIDKNATNEEVKKAYKKMAIKYHPDKVEYLGEDFKKAANEKFKKVNEAYEQIKKARGIN